MVWVFWCKVKGGITPRASERDALTTQALRPAQTRTAITSPRRLPYPGAYRGVPRPREQACGGGVERSHGTHGPLVALQRQLQRARRRVPHLARGSGWGCGAQSVGFRAQGLWVRGLGFRV